jgi:hypothetical protein
MDDDDESLVLDVIILVCLVGFFFLMLRVIYVIRDLNDSTVEKVCKKGPSVTLKKHQITDAFATDFFTGIALGKMGGVPAGDLTIQTKLNCS